MGNKNKEEEEEEEEEGEGMGSELAVTFEENARPICTLALGCFCEIDGPTIVWTTQAFPSAALVMLDAAAPAAFAPAAPSASAETPRTPRARPVPRVRASPAAFSPSGGGASPIAVALADSYGSASSCASPGSVSSAASSLASSAGVAKSLVFVPRASLQKHLDAATAAAAAATTPQRAPLVFAAPHPESPQRQGGRPPPGAGESPQPSLRLAPGRSECPLCSSLPETQGFVSADEATDTVFVSKRTIAESYSVVRQACIRALSCEWSPKERPSAGSGLQLTPVLYGNSAIGFSLSLMFRVVDSRARGAVRWFAVVTTWQDPMYLMAIACSGLLSVAIEPLVRDIQTRAAALRQRELAMPAATASASASAAGAHSATEPTRLRSFGSTGFRQQAGGQRHRSLAEIAGLPPGELFRRFHVAFCSALIAIDRKLFVPGPKCAPQYIPARVFQFPPPGVFGTGTAATADTAQPGGDSDSSARNDDNDDAAAAAAAAHSDSHGAHRRSRTLTEAAVPLTLPALLEQLGHRGVRTLLYNVAVGNQIVVKGTRRVASATVAAIAELLPEALRGTVVPWATHYRDSWECRFLGMPLDAAVPADLALRDPSSASTAAAATSASAAAAAAGSEPQGAGSEAAAGAALGSRAVVVIGPGGDASISGPVASNVQLVAELRDALHSTLLAQAAPGTGPLPPLAVLRVQLVHERWLTKAKLATALRAAGAFNTDARTAESLAVLGLTPHDLPVVQFWSAAVRSAMGTLEAQAQAQEAEAAQAHAPPSSGAEGEAAVPVPVPVPVPGGQMP